MLGRLGTVDLLGRLRGRWAPDRPKVEAAIAWLQLRAFGSRQWAPPRHGLVIGMVRGVSELFYAFGISEAQIPMWIGFYDLSRPQDLTAGAPALVAAPVLAAAPWSVDLPDGGPMFRDGIVVAPSLQAPIYDPGRVPVEFVVQGSFLQLGPEVRPDGGAL
jgi:hypothetical protein